jgi:hypothetical protein
VTVKEDTIAGFNSGTANARPHRLAGKVCHGRFWLERSPYQSHGREADHLAYDFDAKDLLRQVGSFIMPSGLDRCLH